MQRQLAVFRRAIGLQRTARPLENAMRPWVVLLAISAASTVAVEGVAQEPIAVGDGSYAATLPDGPTEFWAGDVVNVARWHATVPLHVMPGIERPLPTNEWWSALLFHNVVEQRHALWAHPLNVTVAPQGIGVHFADAWSGPHGAFQETFFIETPAPLVVGARGLIAREQKVKAWGDWTVQFRVSSADEGFMDVTIGHGMPCVWVEYSAGSLPRIVAAGATFFDRSGETVALPFAGDALGLTWEGRHYAICAPAGTVFTASDDAVELSLPAGPRLVTVCAMPARGRLEFFRRHASAVPRDSRISWTYDAEAGTLATEWTLETEPLSGTERRVIQGWLPHHVRSTRQAFELTGDDYTTARGRMRCAVGTDFRITYDFPGALSHLPPSDLPDFDRGRMHDFLDAFARWKHPFNSETYAGGKQVAMFARQLACATQLRHPQAPVLAARLNDELANVFTFTPGEADKFFGFSPRFGGLIGFRCGFGSHRFNDHHFHYGYYVYAAAILAMHDPDFARRYGEMATLVAKTYANWDRADRRFPFMRTLDIWEGHSWAGGGADNSPWFGENQESSSEAMMSWAALIALGTALGDETLTAAGVFGYVMEAAATDEYWFNRHGDTFPAAFGPQGRISCITWGNQIQYITYFGPEPIFVHGIQYLPILPSSTYLVRHPEAAATEFRYLLANAGSEKYERLQTRDSWEPQWAAEAMRYAALFDPAWASDWFEELWRAEDPKATDPWEGGLTSYWIDAHKSLGRHLPDMHIATADSSVFHNAKSGRFTYVARNATATPQAYNVYRGPERIGAVHVPPRSVVAVHDLSGNQPPHVVIESPRDEVTTREATIVLQALANDPDGSVASVDFYDRGTLLGTAARPPYTLRLDTLEDGKHAIVARASDDRGLTAFSPVVTVVCDLPVADILLAAPVDDFSARMTGKADPLVTFIPGPAIAGCEYVDILVKRNGKDAGAFRMTRGPEGFVQRITAAVGDTLACSFTYHTPPSGERNTHASPCIVQVGSATRGEP